MTNKTVTMSRELAERLAHVLYMHDAEKTGAATELDALIAAPVVDCQPDPIIGVLKSNLAEGVMPSFSGGDLKHLIKLLEHSPELAELQATIARLREEVKTLRNTSVKEEVFDIICKERDQFKAEIERLKGGQGEAVAWKIFDGEGGYDYSEDADYVENWKSVNGDKYASWVTPLYTSQPAPVSVAPKPVIWRIPISGEWFYGTKEQCEREYAEYTADFTSEDFDEDGPMKPEPLVCLDKVKELNQ